MNFRWFVFRMRSAPRTNSRKFILESLYYFQITFESKTQYLYFYYFKMDWSLIESIFWVCQIFYHQKYSFGRIQNLNLKYFFSSPNLENPTNNNRFQKLSKSLETPNIAKATFTKKKLMPTLFLSRALNSEAPSIEWFLKFSEKENSSISMRPSSSSRMAMLLKSSSRILISFLVIFTFGIWFVGEIRPFLFRWGKIWIFCFPFDFFLFFFFIDDLGWFSF